MKFFVLFFISLAIFASDYKINTDINLFTEQYKIEDYKTKLNTIYTNIDLNEYNSKNDGRIILSLIGNLVFNKDDELDLYNFNKSKVIVSNASYEYLFTNFAVSIGRNKIDLPLLQGSFDGIITYYIDNYFSIRTFWFNNFETLYPSYYNNYTNIDNKNGLKGTIFSYQNEDIDSMVYIYSDAKHQYFTGLYLYTLLPYNLEIGFDNMRYINNNISNNDESLYKIFTGYISNDFNLQFGYIKAEDNGIDKIYKYGRNQLNQFGLGNMLYLKNSSNVYFLTKYKKKSFLFQFLYGETTYDNNFLNNLKANETNITFFYKINKKYDIYSSYIIQNVDKNDDLYSNIQLTTVNLKIKFQ